MQSPVPSHPVIWFPASYSVVDDIHITGSNKIFPPDVFQTHSFPGISISVTNRHRRIDAKHFENMSCCRIPAKLCQQHSCDKYFWQRKTRDLKLSLQQRAHQQAQALH